MDDFFIVAQSGVDTGGGNMPIRTIDRLFTSDIINSLAAIQRHNVSEYDVRGWIMRDRHLIVQAIATDDRLHGQRQMWADYLDEAESVGLVANPSFVSRLTGTDDDNFRSALGEAMTVYYLNRELGMSMKANPESTVSGERSVDLVGQAGTQDVHVEVKAPHVPRTGKNFSGDPEAILGAIRSAGGQFKKGRANILVVTPLLRVEVYDNRHQILKPTIGERALAIPIQMEGSERQESYPTFVQDGKLAMPRYNSSGVFAPNFTRIGVVMSIENRYRHVDNGPNTLGHAAVVVHNPFAEVPIDPAVFGDVPQWVCIDGMMHWTDNYSGH